MDRGIPTEDVLAEMRQSDPPVAYLVGTPKGRLGKLEKSLVGLPWHEVRPGVEVKLLAEDDELYVFAQSRSESTRSAPCEAAAKWLWARLAKLAQMDLTRESLLMKLGAARAKAPAAWRLLDITVDPHAAAFAYALNRKKLRQARRREGRYRCAPTCAGATPPNCGDSRFNSSKSRPPSRTSRTICNYGRSTTSWRAASRRTSSWPFSPIACTSRCAPSSGRWPPASPRAPSPSIKPGRRHPDARRPLPHHRRPNADHEPIHRAERRPETPPAAPRPHPAAAATARIAAPGPPMQFPLRAM